MLADPKTARSSRSLDTVRSGYAGLPTTPEAYSLVHELLEKDRTLHHCFRNANKSHNHLSHHLLAVYDLGGPASLLQAIYDNWKKRLIPINDPAFSSKDITITTANWAEHLGAAQAYSSYLKFFTAQIEELGVVEALNLYLFSHAATSARMLNRLMALLCNPLIQLGYGTEFGGNAAVAQGLAQAAVHVMIPYHELLDPEKPAVASGTPILKILKQFCESDVLVPLPYDPTPGKVNTIMDLGDGRIKKIRELSALWLPSNQLTEEDIDAKVEELSWFAAILLVCTSKRGHRHRLDFFLMHSLASTISIRSLLLYIPDVDNRRRLLESYLTLGLTLYLLHGRPKIDFKDTMQYSLAPKFTHNNADATDAIAPVEISPWPGIIQEVVHAKDSQTVKTVRALYVLARRYGHRQAGEISGAEAFPEGDKLDGSLFVRGARIVLDIMGWVTRGDKAGRWDFVGLGWDEVWEKQH